MPLLDAKRTLLLTIVLSFTVAACDDRRPSSDAGRMDAGSTDAGPTDAGAVDAGLPSDAGSPDAGPCPLGASCDDGDACTEMDRCTATGCVGTPRVCDSPDPAECVGDTLRTYAAVGTCEEGSCRYATTDTPCIDGCEAGPPAACAEPPARAWVGLGVASAHTCAVRSTGEVWCWGTDASGQVGDGTAGSRHLAPVQAIGVTGAASIDGYDLVSDGHTCAVLASGAVQCWGAGTQGQLGQGLAESSAMAVDVVGVTDAVQVVTGSAFSCALRATGQVACWGRGDGGALGLGDRMDNLMPTTIPGLTDIVQIDAGLSFVCGVQSSGQVYCWGYDGNGQIGPAWAGMGFYATSPVAVTGVDDATQVATGSSFACALRPTGLSCWGDNRYGQLGNGETADRQRDVVSLAMSGIQQIAAGQGHLCARFSDGSVDCWGRNNSGQLGNRSDAPSLTPVDVYGVIGAHDLVADGSTTCVMVGDTASCWGNNYYGNLGVGTRDDSLEPVAVWLPE